MHEQKQPELQEQIDSDGDSDRVYEPREPP